MRQAVRESLTGQLLLVWRTERIMRINGNDVVDAIGAYEKEVDCVLTDISGEENGSVSELLNDMPWRNAADDPSSESFACGFVFGLFVAKSILNAASSALMPEEEVETTNMIYAGHRSRCEMYYCKKCHAKVAKEKHSNLRFCPNCGREVSWTIGVMES